MNNNILQITAEEQALRVAKLKLNVPTLIVDNADLFYLTGRVFAGYLYLVPGEAPKYFVRRPSVLTGENITFIRKPEDIGAQVPALGLELGMIPYSDAIRLQKAFGADELVDVTPNIMAARAVKTPTEISLLETDGLKHVSVYRHIAGLYAEGMTDVEFQVEIERLCRLQGCLGQFRVNGPSMELHMGQVLVGDNADSPSPYDFAMGGAGVHPSLPVGASGEVIRRGKSVLIDMNGNFNGYMTDMTRTFAFSEDSLTDQARAAHRCSIEICRHLAEIGTPGTEAKVLYNEAVRIATEAGLDEFFMGHNHHASFIGHGVGIQINEWPVLAPRSKHVLAEGNVIAIEPKFVIPGVGAVGIENTYVCTAKGLRCLTPAPENIIPLI
jgi:Xaa-Pro aminopeptidase